jgi:hypothetical protein
MSPVRYELGFYIPEDYILHSHRRVNLKSHRKGVVCCYRPLNVISLRSVEDERSVFPRVQT